MPIHLRFLSFFGLLILCGGLLTVPSSAQPTAKETLDLTKCIEMALERNIDQKKADYELDSYRWSYLRTFSALSPSMDLSTGWSRQTATYDYSNLYVPGMNPELLRSLVYKTDRYDFGLSVNWAVLRWELLTGIPVATAQYSQSRLANQQAREALKAQVTQSYALLLRSQRIVEVRRLQMERSQAQLELADARAKLGSLSLSDVLKLRVRQAQDHQAYIAAQGEVQNNCFQMNRLLGRPAASPLAVVGLSNPLDADVNLETEVNWARENHPQVKQSDDLVTQREWEKKRAWGGWLPSVRGSINYGWSDSTLKDAPVPLFEKNNNDYTTYSVSLSWNLFSGLDDFFSYSAAKAQLRVAERGQEAAREDVEIALRKAWQAVQESKAASEVAKTAAQSAGEDLNLVQARFELGAATTIELLDAEATAQGALVAAIEAEIALYTAWDNFRRATGRWYREE